MSDMWVKLGAPENEIQFNSLDRAMNRSEPGTVIRLLPGRHELTVALNPDVVIKGIGNGCMIVDPHDQLKDSPPVQFLTIISPLGKERKIRPSADPKVVDMVEKITKEQEQIAKIKKIMGNQNKYPNWVKSYKFRFGKYKGETADKVIEEDPKYLKWMYENVDGIDLKLHEIIREYSDTIGV